VSSWCACLVIMVSSWCACLVIMVSSWCALSSWCHHGVPAFPECLRSWIKPLGQLWGPSEVAAFCPCPGARCPRNLCELCRAFVPCCAAWLRCVWCSHARQALFERHPRSSLTHARAGGKEKGHVLDACALPLDHCPSIFSITHRRPSLPPAGRLLAAPLVRHECRPCLPFMPDPLMCLTCRVLLPHLPLPAGLSLRMENTDTHMSGLFQGTLT